MVAVTVGQTQPYRKGYVMRQPTFLKRAMCALVGLALCAPIAVTAQSAGIDHSVDGRAVVANCMSFMEGNPPTSALVQNGFKVRNNKRATSFRKNAIGGIIPGYLILFLVKRPSDPTYSACNILVALPNRVMVELRSPEYFDFETALRTEMKSRGYSVTVKTDRMNRDTYIWAGRKGTFHMTISVQSPVITVTFGRS